MEKKDLIWNSLTKFQPYINDNSDKTEYGSMSYPLKSIANRLFVNACVKNVEDKLMESRNSSFEYTSDIYDGYPLLFTYFMITIAVIVFIAIPFVVLYAIKKKPTLNSHKNPTMFVIECTLLIFGFVGIILASVMSLQTALNFQSALKKFPAQIDNMQSDFEVHLYNYESQIKRVEEHMSTVIDRIMDIYMNVQKDIDDLTLTSLPTPALSNTIKTLQSFGDNVDKFISNREFKCVNGTKKHKIENNIEEFKTELTKICKSLKQIRNNISSNVDMDNSTKEIILNNFSQVIASCFVPVKNYEFPDWHSIYYEMATVAYNEFPPIFRAVHYKFCMLKNIRCQTKSTLDDVYNEAKSLKKRVRYIRKKINKLITVAIPSIQKITAVKYAFNLSDYGDSINESYTISQMNFMIILFLPILYCGLVVVVIMLGLYFLPNDLENIQKSSSYTNGLDAKPKCIGFFKTAVLMIMLILWLWFLLSGLLFAASIYLNAQCNIATATPALAEYIDKTPKYREKNTTAISYWIKENIKVDVGEIHMYCTLCRCQRKLSIYSSLGLSRKWGNAKEWLGLDDLQFFCELSDKLFNAIDNFQILDTQWHKKRISDLIKSMDAKFSVEFIDQIQTDFKIFSKFSLENSTHAFLETLPKKSKFYDRVQMELFNLTNKYQNTSKLYLNTIGNYSREIWAMKNSIRNMSHKLGELKYLTKMLNHDKKGVRSRLNKYIRDLSLNVTNLIRISTNNIMYSIEHEMGVCHVLPKTINKATNIVCKYGFLPIMHSSWIGLTILAFSMLFTAIMLCRIMAYIRGSEESAKEWRKRLEDQKIASLTYIGSLEKNKTLYL